MSQAPLPLAGLWQAAFADRTVRRALASPARRGGRRLAPGRYRLLAAPRDALGTGGAVKRAAFRVEP